MMRWGLVAYAIGCVGVVRAGSCAPAVQAYSPVVAAVAAPLVYVPVYTVQYLPPAAVTAEAERIVEERDATEAEALAEKLDELTKELASLRGELARVRGGSGNHGAADATYTGLLLSKCGSCHSPKVDAEKRGDFVLVEADGKPSVLSLEQKRRVARKVQNGSMPPPPGKLTDGEKKLLLDYLKKGE